MYQFFVEPAAIDEENHRVIIAGDDYNHIKNVLRMRQGEEVNVSDGMTLKEYRCRIESFEEDRVICELCFIKEALTELPSKIYLYQGLPKSDKLELIVQKAVELGVCEVIPVACKRSVVKLDEKKAAKKTERLQTIAEAAAKQSKRGYIPKVSAPMSFGQAVKDAAARAAIRLLPYELADSKGMENTRSIISAIKPGQDIAIFIGPEGGFDDDEIRLALENDMHVITLGRRILRTETAGLMVLSWLVLMLEGMNL